MPYENMERAAGNTKWKFWGLFRYAIGGIIDFSQVPLSIASWFGLGMTVFSFIMMGVIIAKKLIIDDPVQGWSSLVCIIIFIGGIQLFCMGIMGQYIAKTFVETKNRPHYIISESNLDEER